MSSVVPKSTVCSSEPAPFEVGAQERFAADAGVNGSNAQKGAVGPLIVAKLRTHSCERNGNQRSKKRAQQDGHEGKRGAEEGPDGEQQHDVPEAQSFLVAKAVKSFADYEQQSATDQRPHQRTGQR